MISGLIRRTYKYLDIQTFKKLYVALVRPHVEYAQAVWSPHYMKDIEQVENVQRRATRQIPGLKELTYDQRLKKLKLPSLRYRRARGDMIEAYKILDNKNLYDPRVVGTSNKSERVHDKQLYPKEAKKALRRSNFVYRITEPWNGLHKHVVNAPSLNSFKNRLDIYWSKQSMLYDWEAQYDPKENHTPKNWKKIYK